MIYRYTYKITLLKGNLEGQYYFGQHRTNNLNDNYAGSGKIVRNYYKKYGAIEGVTYNKDIIAFYDNDDELNEAEYNLIGDKYDTDPLCLNFRAGGMQCGFSEEARKKMSEAAKLRDNNKFKKGMQSWNKGRTGIYSEETLKKMSESNKGKIRSSEVRQKLSERSKGNKYHLGHKHTEETKQKNREAHLNKKASEETKRKMSISHKGKKMSCKYAWVHIYVPSEQKLLTKRVDIDYIYYWLDDGWIIGRGTNGKSK